MPAGESGVPNRGKRLSGIRLRPATAGDVELYYRWVNDPGVRASAFDPRPISYERHREWFAEKMAGPGFLLVIEDGGGPVGQIRIDIEGAVAVVDLSVAASHRGKGYGTDALVAAAGWIAGRHPELRELVGVVKSGNTASRRAFLKAGFHETESASDRTKFTLVLAGNQPRPRP